MRERDVYEIWSQDRKQVYVGLSVNSKKRAGQHKHSKTAGGLLNSGGTMKTVASALQQSDAVEMERSLIAKYRSDPRVKCLNRRAGGQLGSGGGRVWTKEKVYEIAKGCKTRSEFFYRNGSAYHAARRDGYFNELCEEFGFQPSLHKLTRPCRDSLFRKFNECSSIFDLDQSDRDMIIRRGLWKEFAGLYEVRSDNIPDDFARRLRYFPNYRDNVNKPWSEFLSHYESYPFDPSKYMNELTYFGEYEDTLQQIKSELTQYCCRKAGILWVDTQPVAPRYKTTYISKQKDFPEGYLTIDLMIRYPNRWSLKPHLCGKVGKIINFLRNNSRPKTVENAIRNGKLPIPTHRHVTGALFPIKSVVQWALDTPSEACYP